MVAEVTRTLYKFQEKYSVEFTKDKEIILKKVLTSWKISFCFVLFCFEKWNLRFYFYLQFGDFTGKLIDVEINKYDKLRRIMIQWEIYK